MSWRQSLQGDEGGASGTALLDQHIAVTVKADAAPSTADQPLDNPLNAVPALDNAMPVPDPGDNGISVVFLSEATARDPGPRRETDLGGTLM